MLRDFAVFCVNIIKFITVNHKIKKKIHPEGGKIYFCIAGMGLTPSEKNYFIIV